ncbi:MAG: sigma-70 family RNA polymerase sigma factor [Bacteroidales bacterium]|nr:sigma-70 family RNA polymerase sigma factor [Bacteroidales bacterium]
MELNSNLSQRAIEDYKLVQKSIQGDENAYAELMKRYYDSLYYLLLRMTNNKTDAEDLTIEAFTKAFKNIHSYTPTYAFSTWLFKIATNNCIDFLRRKNTNVTSLNDFPDSERSPEDVISSDTLDPEELLIREQKQLIISYFMEKLKPHYRMLIELRFFKELSYEEIAKIMNIPIGTVKSQLFRAKEFLYYLISKSKYKI